MSGKSPEPSEQPIQRGTTLAWKQSSGSLHSKYDRSTDRSEFQRTSSPQPPSTQHSNESWSLWPKRNGSVVGAHDNTVDVSTEQKSITTMTNETDNTPVGISNVNTEVHEASPRSVSPKKKAQGILNQGSRWIPWSMSSVHSEQQQIPVLQKDRIKVIVDDYDGIPGSNEIPNASKASRSTSWSFWNNSTDHGSDSNKLLISKSDAVLFKPTEINPQGKKNNSEMLKDSISKNKNFEPKISNKVVPLFDKSLPYKSPSSSLYNNFTTLKYNLGFTVTPPSHLYRHSSTPKDIKKVLIIGVHGFFPTKVLRPLIGEPTGTSLKFTAEAEKCIWRWAQRENLNIEVQKIALEKEGKILDRVEFFYKVLENWQEDLKHVDYIYIAAHSQGCPVSIILLAKLIENGVIEISKVKISLLAMAGINNGPFYGVDQKLVIRAYSTIENDSLMELFQFQKFDSPNSALFLESIKTLLKNNVKITFVGSVNDQLVPLYSSHALHIRHPNIFRATYVDRNSNTPEFVTRAVSIANHLHNIGLSDHGLIKEISNALAGPLTGGGHSKIYNDPQVYDLALHFSLYTTNLGYDIPLHFKPYSIEQLGVNPYHLPWCMRGLLHEAKHHFKDGGKEIELLFKEFDEWKPDSKVLKDMKYRLNGLKSKL